MKIQEILRTNEVFKQLSDEEITSIAGAAKTRTYPRNTFVFWQNEKVLNGYLIEQGLIKLYRAHSNGRLRTIGLKSDGELVSEFSLLFPFNHLATAQVLARSSIICFPVEIMAGVTRENDGFQKVLRKSVNGLIERSLLEIENRIFMNINGCLAGKLLQLSQKFGVARDGGTVINLKLSQQQLADMIGTNRETVCKALIMFKKSKAISIKKKLITIIDRDKLASWE